MTRRAPVAAFGSSGWLEVVLVPAVIVKGVFKVAPDFVFHLGEEGLAASCDRFVVAV